MKQPMSLENLLPEKPTATIKGKTYSFRAPSLADDVWIRQNIGDGEQLKKMTTSLDWRLIAMLAYHLIDMEGKKDFRARKLIGVSDKTGEEVESWLTGPEVLLDALTGVMDGVQVLGAITRAMANANPMVEDMVKKSLEDAKKLASPAKAPIGAKSSTRSQVNTKSRKRNSRR